MDRRHLRRQKIVQQLYASTYEDDLNVTEQHEKTSAILAITDQLDAKITKYAQKYDIENIAKVDLAILRLAVYELLEEKKVPPKVIINEAVELAKELGGDKSPGFVNAVLGKIYEEHDISHDTDDSKPETT